MDRIKHNKRGSTYAVLGDAAFQVSFGLPSDDGETMTRLVRDGDPVRVYRSEDDDKLYARFPDEFTPDRFTPLEAVVSVGDDGPRYSMKRMRDEIARAKENERLRFAEDLDKWMKAIGAGTTGYQPEAYALMDAAVAELVQLRRLRDHVQKFVKDQEITCAETIYQSDRVIENAFDLIEGCCNIVGYHKHEDEE